MRGKQLTVRKVYAEMRSVALQKIEEAGLGE